jgi:hypothetical protein
MAHTFKREARQIKRDGILGRIASGNHLAAQNDEGEPEPDEAALLAADVQHAQHKAARYHQINDSQARVLDLQHLDAMRREGAL